MLLNMKTIPHVMLAIIEYTLCDTGISQSLTAFGVQNHPKPHSKILKLSRGTPFTWLNLISVKNWHFEHENAENKMPKILMVLQIPKALEFMYKLRINPQINKSNLNSMSSKNLLNLYLKRHIREFIEILILSYKLIKWLVQYFSYHDYSFFIINFNVLQILACPVG